MIDLKGHSGCKLVLINDDKKSFVRKISKDINYNDRIKLQCKKQENFKHSQILAPKVLNKGYESGLFYFDMEYVNGLKYNEFIKVNNFEHIKTIFSTILEFIFENISAKNVSFKNEIQHKIDSLLKTNLIDNLIIDSLIMQSKKPIPTGYCHGDLTFENIIISKDKIYLIDFLDSYIDSPIIDISKLIQEFDLNWSNRRNKFGMSSVIKNHFLKGMLLEKISNSSIDKNVIDLQKKLTLMRILPYTSNLKLKLKLINIINKQI